MVSHAARRAIEHAEQDRKLYDWLYMHAIKGLPCPSRARLRNELGRWIEQAMARCCQAGKFAIEISDPGPRAKAGMGRQRRIVFPDGEMTDWTDIKWGEKGVGNMREEKVTHLYDDRTYEDAEILPPRPAARTGLLAEV